jgi:hypothetical protein
MDKSETTKWLQAFGGGCGPEGEPAAMRVDATFIKKYGIYEVNGDPVIIVLRDKDGKRVGTEHCRAGTKNAARRLAKQYGATWRKEDK